MDLIISYEAADIFFVSIKMNTPFLVFFIASLHQLTNHIILSLKDTQYLDTKGHDSL